MGAILYISFLWLASKFVLQGFGEKPHGVQTLALCVFASILCASKKSFWFIVFPFALFFGFYSPVGFVYGQPSYQFVVSLFATNPSEASEFFQQFSLSLLSKGVAIPIFAVLAHLVAVRVKLKPWRNKTYVMLVICILLLYGRPTDFFKTFWTAFFDAGKESNELMELMRASSWKDVSFDSNPKDFVLVIGESVRRDYLNLYGYPVDNMPFLKNAKGVTVVDGLTSAAHFTAGSLRLMLTDADHVNWKPRYDRNLISLAKAAGYRTVWFSNQGFSGIDTPVSAIAKNADRSFFVTGGDYTIANISDFVLLPLLRNELKKSSPTSRLIVLHTIGSHPLACKRIEDMAVAYRAEDNAYSQIACYLTSIRKADIFLKGVVDALNENKAKTGRPYSVIWFSDHGQSQYKMDGVYTFRNEEQCVANYSIPLIKIESEIEGRKYIKSYKSGLRFTCGLAGWLGIQAKDLPLCSLFDGKNDPDFGMNERLKNASQDPAIYFEIREE